MFAVVVVVVTRLVAVVQLALCVSYVLSSYLAMMLEMGTPHLGTRAERMLGSMSSAGTDAT